MKNSTAGRFLMAVLLLALCVANASRSVAQSSSNPVESSPWQRWLPPPQSLTPDAQAKLLARVRDMVLKSDSLDSSNPSQLSSAEVQLLKEAMKRFGGNLPEGLSPETLDAIPSELISKALSNPELRRQAKEMAEQYMKRESSKPSNDPRKQTDSAGRGQGANSTGAPDASSQPNPNENAGAKPSSKQNTQGPSPRPANSESAPSALGNSSQSPENGKPVDSSQSPSDPKSPDFKELMDKLRKTQEQFERSKNGEKPLDSDSEEINLDEALKEFNSRAPKKEPQEFDFDMDLNTDSGDSKKQGGLTPTPKPNVPNNNSSKAPSPRPTPSGNAKPKPSATTPLPSPSSSSGRNPSPPPGATRQENKLNPSPAGADRDRRSPNNANSEWGNGEVPRKKTPQAGVGPNESVSSEPKDLRKELERKGLGPTLQKMIDDARANIAKGSKPTATKAPADAKNTTAIPNEVKNSQPSNATTSSPRVARSTETTPNSPPKQDSEVTKGLKQAGNYLSELWSQISKPANSEIRESAASGSESTASASEPSMNFPDPFDSRALAYVAAFAIVGVIVFFALRSQVRTEQARSEAIQAQLATRIEEIRTREDFVRAFHAFARQRLKVAEEWWTKGYVTQQFDSSMPQHTNTIRTLSQLYDQARYYPDEHQLTQTQIDEAKLAFKQCT